MPSGTEDEPRDYLVPPQGPSNQIFATHTDINAMRTPGMHLPAGWNKNWLAALANAKAGTGLARLALVSDSLGVGWMASDIHNKSFYGLIRKQLHLDYGDGGSGFQGVRDTPVGMAANGILTAIQTAWQTASGGNLPTCSAGWASHPEWLAGPGFFAIATATNGATATWQCRGTQVKVFYMTGGTAATSFTVSIDGGAPSAPVVVSTNVFTIAAWTSPTLAPGTHTVVVTATVTAGGGLYLCGAQGRNATGVVCDKYANGGYTTECANNVVGTVMSVPGTASTFGGAASNLGPGYGGGQWSGGSANPTDLILYTLGGNDAGLAAAPPGIVRPGLTSAQNVRRFLDDVRSASPLTDILFLMPHAGKLDTAYVYADYLAQIRALATSYGAGVVDMWAIGRNSWAYWNSFSYWGDETQTDGRAGVSGVHLSDVGHQHVKDVAYPVLTTAVA